MTDDARLIPQSGAGGPRIDTSLANVARAWNFMVGGKDNFEADRAAARQLMEVAPVIRVAAPASRAFLGRAVRDSGTILSQAGRTLDFAAPVAIMMIDLLDFIEDDKAAAATAAELTDAVPPGSYLTIMHPASDLDPALREAERHWNQLAAQRVRLRSREQVAGYLAGLELVEPGLVTVPEWRPDPGEPVPGELIPLYAVVARKP